MKTSKGVKARRVKRGVRKRRAAIAKVRRGYVEEIKNLTAAKEAYSESFYRVRDAKVALEIKLRDAYPLLKSPWRNLWAHLSGKFTRIYGRKGR